MPLGLAVSQASGDTSSSSEDGKRKWHPADEISKFVDKVSAELAASPSISDDGQRETKQLQTFRFSRMNR